MRGGFVVQLRKIAPDSQLEGVVEEVDTGKQAKFRSDRELIEFLRERFIETTQRLQQKEGNE
jgi:hypothetical protein